jgi:hypothetical protein
MKRFLPRPTYANVVSTLCLFLLLGGASAFAATKLAKNSVGATQIKKNAVVTAKIKNAAVTNSKLAENAVTSGKLADAAVTNSKLADAAVTSGKITDKAVTSGKLADNAVTNSKLSDNAVTTGKIVDSAVTNPKLAANAVTTGKIADGEVRATDLGTIVTAQKTVQIEPGLGGTVDVACPAGSVMLGGGGYWTTNVNSLRTSVKEGNGWRVEGKNNDAAGQPLTAQAYCLVG